MNKWDFSLLQFFWKSQKLCLTAWFTQLLQRFCLKLVLLLKLGFWSKVCFSCRIAKHTEGLWVLHGLLAVSSSNAPWLVFDRTHLYHLPVSRTQNVGCTLELARVQHFCSSWFWLCSSLNVSTSHKHLLKDCSVCPATAVADATSPTSGQGAEVPGGPLCCGCSQWEFPILKTFLKVPYLLSYTWIYLWTYYFTCF